MLITENRSSSFKAVLREIENKNFSLKKVRPDRLFSVLQTDLRLSRLAEIKEPLALVVGVWTPGIRNKVITVGMDYDWPDESLKRATGSAPPDFVGDFMQIPSEQLGLKKYTRIVFQGCCPVASSMGAASCIPDETVASINAKKLAEKVDELSSNYLGATLYFRHCLTVAGMGKNGICDQDQRDRFILAFEERGYQLVMDRDLTPDGDIPDPHPEWPAKWARRNGALVFYRPAS